MKFGIEPAGVGYVRNQSVESLDVVLDHSEEALPTLIGLGQGQRFPSRAQRGAGIAQRVCDICAEALDPFNAAIERVCHVTQRAREFSDFVASARGVGHFNATANTETEPFGTV